MIETIPVLLKLPSSHGRFNEVVHMISESLRENGLTFILGQMVLDEQDLTNIYPHLPIIILNAQIAQFAHEKLWLWIVEGNEAIEIVTQCKGSNNDPAECMPNTWRFKIAKMLGRRTMTLRSENGEPRITIFNNFIHAPKRDEVERDMNAFPRFA